MSPTRQLLRIDIRWAGPLALIGLLGHLLAQASDDVASLWIYPKGDWGLMNMTYHAIAAGVLGIISAGVDDVTRTREYLLHRPLSPARIFWTRQGLLLVLLLGWVLLTPTLLLAGAHLFSSDAALIDDGRWLLRVVEGVPVFLSYALAVFSASVTRVAWRGALLAFVAGLLAWGILMACMVEDSFGGVALVALTISLALTPLLLAGALRCQRQGRDPDRPWEMGRLRLAAPLLLLVTAFIMCGALTIVHASAIAKLFDIYPDVVQHEGRSVLRRWHRDENTFRQLDEQHRWQGPLPEGDDAIFDASSANWKRAERDFKERPFFPNQGIWYRGQLFLVSYQGTYRRAFFSSDGHVYLYRLAVHRGVGDDRPVRWVLGKAPDGRPFSPGTRILTDCYGRHAVFFDPGDGGLWAYDLRGGEGAAFTRLDLPAGDRFVDVHARLQYLSPNQRYAPGLPEVTVRGERGLYGFDGAIWRPLPPDVANDAHPPRLTPILRYQRAGRMQLTLTSPDGQGVFSHDYRPYTLAERTLETLAEAPTLLRPPPATLLSAWSGPDRAYRVGPWLLLLDPAVALGSRGTLIGNLILTMLLAGLTFRRLARLGASGSRRWFWTIAILLLGFPGFLCARLVETNRAWRPVAQPIEARPAPAGRLLLTV